MNARPAGAAIAGLGMTDLGKVFGRSPRRLAAEAVRLAVADAGLDLAEVDGLLACPGIAARETLLIKRCQQCGIWLGPEAGGCPDCGDTSAGQPGWVPASGHGTLISWAVIHPRPAPQDTPPGRRTPGGLCAGRHAHRAGPGRTR